MQRRAKLLETKRERAETLLAAGVAAWPSAETAASRLREMGAPHARDEYWRFARPDALLEEAARIEGEGALPDFDGHVLALNTAYETDALSALPLAEAMDIKDHWARAMHGTIEALGQTPVTRPLAALNTARAEAGLAIEVTGKAETLVLDYDTITDHEAPLHFLVRVAPEAHVTVIETGRKSFPRNIVFEVELADRAGFDHVRVQLPSGAEGATGASHIFTRMGAEAEFHSFTLSGGAKMRRNETFVHMNGDDAKLSIAGASLLDGKVTHDDTVFVTHDAVNCESRQVFKKVVKNKAKSVFQGKILVNQIAQKTDGYQISQGLMLDENSDVLAKPELEIYADDVACSHGSTCSGLDQDMLFYLLSRGVPRAEAQQMLVIAFIDEAIGEIRDKTLADGIRNTAADWIAKGLV